MSETIFMVYSIYSDGEIVREGAYRMLSEAEEAAQRVREFRDDQDEAPVVEVWPRERTNAS